MVPPSSSSAPAGPLRPSAVRSWPPGCGRSLPPSGDPTAVAAPVVVADPPAAALSRPALPQPLEKDVPPAGIGARSTSSASAPESVVAAASAPESKKGVVGGDDCVSSRDRKRWASCTSFPLPKRRTVEAVRRFPPGCGREEGADLRPPALEVEGAQGGDMGDAQDNGGKSLALGGSNVVSGEIDGKVISGVLDKSGKGRMIDHAVDDGESARVGDAAVVNHSVVEASNELANKEKCKSLVQYDPKSKRRVEDPKELRKVESLKEKRNVEAGIKRPLHKSVPGESSVVGILAGPDKSFGNQPPGVQSAVKGASSSIVRPDISSRSAMMYSNRDWDSRRAITRPPLAGGVCSDEKAEGAGKEKSRGREDKKNVSLEEDHQTGASLPSLLHDDMDESLESALDASGEQEGDDSSSMSHGENDENLEGDEGERTIILGLKVPEQCSPSIKGEKSIHNALSLEFSSPLEEQMMLPVSNVPARKIVPAKKSVAKKSVPRIGSTKVPIKKNDARQSSIPQGKSKEITPFPGKLTFTLPPCSPTEYDYQDKSGAAAARSKVKLTLRTFQVVMRNLPKTDETKGQKSRRGESSERKRLDIDAYNYIKEKRPDLINKEKRIGDIPGVEIGDEFHYRVELALVGLHGPFQAGIDTTVEKGKRLATSIVASGGYADELQSENELIYTGHGGKAEGNKLARDQELKGGNLALKNCIDAKSPVRVIHGLKDKDSSTGKVKSTFTYDGLYMVERYFQDKTPDGTYVYKFALRRKPNQPELALNILKDRRTTGKRDGLCVEDISQGEETMKIAAINTVDDEVPSQFKYIKKNIYPPDYKKIPPKGCDCRKGCSDSDLCACARRNGGAIPFNSDGAILRAHNLIYECGPACKCPPSCHNRVSQHGISLPLELFKTEKRGWGVRSAASIPSGAFVCEYVGELIADKDADKISNDVYLFDIGHNYDDTELWAGLPSIIPGLESCSPSGTVNTEGFTIDADKCANIGRFINHSCSPNLYAQNVLYDHDDPRVPHIMFFAAENIPPLQELTYHYNYGIDQVRDSEGNIRKKICLCGAPDCSGRLY